MSALVASRNGLSEYELQEALGINAARWSRLWFSLENLLVVRSGLIFPRRLQLRKAVTQRYLRSTQELHTILDKLISHFEEKLAGVCSSDARVHVSHSC